MVSESTCAPGTYLQSRDDVVTAARSSGQAAVKASSRDQPTVHSSQQGESLRRYRPGSKVSTSIQLAPPHASTPNTQHSPLFPSVYFSSFSLISTVVQRDDGRTESKTLPKERFAECIENKNFNATGSPFDALALPFGMSLLFDAVSSFSMDCRRRICLRTRARKSHPVFISL